MVIVCNLDIRVCSTSDHMSCCAQWPEITQISELYKQETGDKFLSSPSIISAIEISEGLLAREYPPLGPLRLFINFFSINSFDI